MATSSVKAQQKGAAQRAKFQQNSQWEQAQFVQRELTPSEQAACKEWEWDEGDAWSRLAGLAEMQYKVTFRWDEYNQCFGAWIMPPKDDSENSGLILTGRGSNAFKAFKQAFYKHSVLFQEVWPRDSDRRGGQEIDD